MHEDLTFEEVDSQHVELLPTRDPLGLRGRRLAAPPTATVGSSAHALALQQLSSVQG